MVQQDFSKQTEAVEYVERIGIEYRFGCLKEKRADSCNLLADFYEAIEFNLAAAFQLYKETCKRSDYSHASCFKYGRYLVNGMECEPDLDEARWAFDRACQKDNVPACHKKAILDYKGSLKRSPDLVEAERTMDKACRMEDAEACFTLSGWFLGNSKAKPIGIKNVKHKDEILQRFESTDAKFPKDMLKALSYAVKACELNHLHGCMNASRMYRLGDGVERNAELARKYLLEANSIQQAMHKPADDADFTG